MTRDHYADLRREYDGAALVESDVWDDPILQFGRWFDAAVAAGIEMANAMTLATADAAGRPSARVVLLKGYDERGFVFFTNYASRKGAELAENPRAALCFWWEPMHRQVRIAGSVEKVDPDESDAYFATRPRESNLGAVASPQSRVIAGRAELEAKVEQIRAAHDGKDLYRPDSWGGYRLAPVELELWQGRPDRLHDRLRYRRTEDGAWVIERLAP